MINQKKEYMKLKVPLLALRTTKKSADKIAMAQSMPSILGLNFLKHQNLSLHVFVREDKAYLE